MADKTAQPAEQPLVYSVPAVAELLGVGTNKVYEMVAGGRIPAIKWGDRSICIPRRALEQYLVEEAFRQQAERQQPTELAIALARTPLRRNVKSRAQ